MFRRFAALALLVALFLPACAWSIGKESHTARSPTLAEELRDLEAAHDEGLLTDAEYGDVRARLLARED